MRPRTLPFAKARKVCTRMRRAGIPITGKSFARAAGISERSAFRYLKAMRLRARVCPRCLGAGSIRNEVAA